MLLRQDYRPETPRPYGYVKCQNCKGTGQIHRVQGDPKTKTACPVCSRGWLKKWYMR